MNKFYQRLLQNKFLILVLAFALISFVCLYIAETYFSLAPRLSEVFRGFAIALLTSGVVGFVFEYLTRKEFTAVIEMTVHKEIQGLEYRLMGRPEEKLSLFSFWRPFMSEGTSIIIAQDESGVEPIVRASDISAAFSLYKGLMETFSMPEDRGKIEIDYVSKTRLLADICSFNRHLIIIGAPGGNPLATFALHRLHGVPSNVKRIKNGYIFAVDLSQPQRYLESPYIVPCGESQPGIWEIRNGKVVNRFDRYASSHPDGMGCDSCLIDYGMVPCDDGQTLYVLIIAGHSRFSSMDGVSFVLTDDNWGEMISKFRGGVATTVLETSISIAHGRVVKIAQPPH